MSSISPSRLSELLAKMKASREHAQSSESPESPQSPEIVQDNLLPQETYNSHIYDKYGKLITLNSAQQSFVSLAASGSSAVLIGAAGTGKTTCQKAVCQALISSGRAGILSAGGHKYLSDGTPGILICAYTRIAVNNIRRNLPADLQANAITIHKALEYQPVYYKDINPTTGQETTRMVFEPARTALNPLPPSIHTVIIEEGSMLDLDLHAKLVAALPHAPQMIYLGDIQQLPPVFGPAILGFKMLELPVIELTEVYRQALESPIISLAHRILSGKPLPHTEFSSLNRANELTLTEWKKKVAWEHALEAAGHFFVGKTRSDGTQIPGLLQAGKYDPAQDMILIPFNVSFGTIEVNKIIANALAKAADAPVYEIIAGFQKYYYRVGDRVMYDREDAIITKIEHNFSYTGQIPAKESPFLDYWGMDSSTEAPPDSDVDFILSQVAAQSSKSEERVRQSSHTITLQLLNTESEVKISKAAEVNAMMLGYALTVHKAQGSEWRRVFFLTHHSHSQMLSRELLYTAVTRAREELYVICEPDGLTKGIASQRVKGNTLAEKAEFFKGKAQKEVA